jgi:hypothetical protein
MFNHDKAGEDRWRARIPKTKERDLNKLLKRRLLMKALNSIMPIPGLWRSFHFGSLDILLSIKFDEVRKLSIIIYIIYLYYFSKLHAISG